MIGIILSLCHQEKTRDSVYVKNFNSRNLSITGSGDKVITVNSIINDEPVASTSSRKYTFKKLPDFDGFVQFSDCLPFKEKYNVFIKCLEKLEQQEFGDINFPFFDPSEHLLNADLEEFNVSNVIPFPEDDDVEEEEDDELTFIKLKGCTVFGNDILMDSFGNQYSLNDQKFNNDESLSKQRWKCVKRGLKDKVNCIAYVCLENYDNPEIFTYVLKNTHNHESRGNVNDMRQLTHHLKLECLRDPFTYPRTLIQEYFLDKIEFKKCLGMNNFPTISSLVKIIRRHRLKFAPPRVRDVFFDIHMEYLPLAFFKGEVLLNDARHLIFFTDEQLFYLCRQKMWFIDGTFKVVSHPFMQLLSINVHIVYNGKRTLVPGAYIFMTRRRKMDYVAVFKKKLILITNFTGNPINLCTIMCDFEVAFWSAWRFLILEDIFPNVILKGCYFHFTQAVFRKVMFFGLKGKYYNDPGTKHLCRKLMALPLLPVYEMIIEFQRLEDHVKTLNSPKIKKFLGYYKKNGFLAIFGHHRIFVILG